MPCKYLKIGQPNLPDVMFVNQYGPTEATASCTYYVVDKQVEDDTVLPIGVPYENYRIILLNEDGTETEKGKTGEICVSGPILALGYYGDKERTEQSFVQNPLNNNYRELIYKTGDLGSFREDGILEFHGRKDRQIKHMGHRIELGEIEETAKQIDGVEDCCSLYYKEKEQLYLFYTGSASSKEIVRPTLIMDLSICPDATSRDAVLLLQPRYSARPLMPCIRLDALCWRSARCSSIHSSNCATVRSVTIVVGVINISILWIKWMIRLCIFNGHLRRPRNLSVPSGSFLVFILNQFVDFLSGCAISGKESVR